MGHIATVIEALVCPQTNRISPRLDVSVIASLLVCVRKLPVFDYQNQLNANIFRTKIAIINSNCCYFNVLSFLHTHYMPLLIEKPKLLVDCPELITKPQVDGIRFTYLHCLCISPCLSYYSDGVSINPETYLTNIHGTEKLPLLHAINIPLDPKKYYFKKKKDELNFTLVFDQIPNEWIVFRVMFNKTTMDWKAFFLIEGRGFSTKPIEKNKNGIYKIIVGH